MTRTRLLAGYDIYLKMMPLLVQAGLLAIGAYLMSIGNLTVGTFLLAFQIGSGLNQFSSAFGEIASAWQYLRSAQDRLAEMLALSARPVTDGRMIPLSSTGLELQGVEVTYGNRRFLHGLDVQVAPGRARRRAADLPAPARRRSPASPPGLIAAGRRRRRHSMGWPSTISTPVSSVRRSESCPRNRCSSRRRCATTCCSARGARSTTTR